MFKSLKNVLMTILTQFAETNYLRLAVAFSVIIPLVTSMYLYLDTAIFDTRQTLYEINTYSYDGFPIGSYVLAYLGVAKFDVCLATIFFYITTAVVWSVTTDLQPALTAGKRR